MPVRPEPLTRSSSDEPVHRRLVIAGLASIPLYGLVTLLSVRFRYGEGHRDRPILTVLALLSLAWVAYAWALVAVRNRGDHSSTEPDRFGPIFGRRLPTILSFAIAFRLILLFSQPIQEIDFYRYLWDGRVLLNGLNPFAHAPAEIDRDGPNASLDTELGKLWQLRSRSDSVQVIFGRIHHREVPTIYPPASQFVFGAAALLTRPEAPVVVHLLVLKVLILSFDLGTLLVLARLLLRLGLSEDLAIAYGWCPLVLKEFANTAHLDAIAVFFTVLAVERFLDGCKRTNDPCPLRGAVIGAVWLGMAVLAKGYPVLILPLIAGYFVSRRGLRSLLPATVFLAVVAAGYAPFVGGAGPSEIRAHSPWTGLGTFLARWQKNDFLFMLVHENLRPPIPDVRDRWFVVLPGNLRRAIDEDLAVPLSRLVGSPDAEPAFLLTEGVMGAIVGWIVLGWGVRVLRRPEPLILLRGIGLVLAWGWLLSSTPHPWYLTWSLPFLIFAGRQSWFLLPGLVFIYYLRFFMEYQALPGGLPAVEQAIESFDYGVVWLEYTPFFAAFAFETWRGQSFTGRAGLDGNQLPSEAR